MTTAVEEMTITRVNTTVPSFYNVVLHNDDATPFDFVIGILTNLFYHSIEQANIITNNIHNTGFGVAGGPYTKEVAEEKLASVSKLSKINGFPLKVTLERS